MCTVTFLPLADGGYLLATNRDESPRRGAAHPPEVHIVGERRVLLPLDSDAGGTWVAVDEGGACLCILNGDRPPARPPEPDAPSRGLLVLDLLRDARPAAVVEHLELRREHGALRARPFQLLVAEPGAAGLAGLVRIDWDGERLDVQRAPAGAGLFVSSTYQREGVARARQAAFAPLAARAARPIAGADLSELAAAQHEFHSAHRAEAPAGDAFSVCMHRQDARTVSCTRLAVTTAGISMAYQPGSPCAGREVAQATLERR